MVAFASLTEFELYVRQDIEPTSVAALEAQQCLDVASDVIRGHTRQTLHAVTADAVELTGNPTDRLDLPQRPVTDVTAISVDGTAIAADEFGWSRSGRLTLTAGTFGDDRTAVTVTYSHGYAIIPGDIRAITLALAARMWVNPEGHSREQLGSYNVGYAAIDSAAGQGAGAPVHLMAHERITLGRYRLQTATL